MIRGHASALTLVEMVLALAISSLLALAMMSSVLAVSRALPSEDDPFVKVTGATAGLTRMMQDVRESVHITEYTSTAITFTVADRNSDGHPETIRYAWSGVVGDPLTRQLNGGTADPVISSVSSFGLSLSQVTLQDTYPGALTQGSEVELSRWDGVGAPADCTIQNNKWAGQLLAPTLPADATGWTISRVLLSAKQSNGVATGQLQVQLRPADSDLLPDATVYEEQVIEETSLLTSYAWQTATFSSHDMINPNTSVCVVVACSSGGKHGDLQADTNASMANFLETTNGGSAWSRNTETTALRHVVYGHVWSTGPDQAVTRTYGTALEVTITPEGQGVTPIAARVGLPNQPEILERVWESDFLADPTQIDFQADGVWDWQPGFESTSFDAGQLSQGVWTPTQSLRTSPDAPLTGVTTIDARMKATTAEQPGALINVFGDWSGNVACRFRVWVELDTSGDQDLVVRRYAAGDTYEDVLTERLTTDDFVNVRVILDATADTLAVFVDGRHLQTFSYSRYTQSGGIQGVNFREGTGAGAFDHVMVRLSGGGT